MIYHLFYKAFCSECKEIHALEEMVWVKSHRTFKLDYTIHEGSVKLHWGYTHTYAHTGTCISITTVL